MLLLGLQVIAQHLRALLEPIRVLARGLHFELDVRVDIGLCERIRKRGGRLRVGPGHRNIDHVALARGCRRERALQGGREPISDRALAAGVLLPLIPKVRIQIEFEVLDDAQRDALAADDVDLRRHVARGELIRVDHASNRVRLGIDDHRGARRVQLDLQKSGNECRQDDGHEHAGRDDPSRAQYQ